MSKIFDKLSNKIDIWRKEAKDILGKDGEKILSEVTISQAYGGMRGIRALICDTSRVPQDQGLIVRGKPLKEIINNSPEEVYYLLLTGELPDGEELKSFSENLKTRKFVPARLGLYKSNAERFPPDDYAEYCNNGFTK